MTVHSRERVWNTGNNTAKRLWIWLLLGFCIWGYRGKATVCAEPVSLESDNAVIYEQANEESSAVGNLVRGSNFELLESVTLEDGSTWYHVSALGIQGYMKGDAVIGTGAAVPEQEESVPGEAVLAGPENAAGGAETENTGEAQTTEPGNTEGETAGELPAVYQGSNMREKTYAVGSGALKTKDRENRTSGQGSISQGKNVEKSGRRFNTAFLFFWLVLAGSALTALVSYRKCREEADKNGWLRGKPPENIKSARNRKSVYRKRKHKKKKGKIKKNGNTRK